MIASAIAAYLLIQIAIGYWAGRFIKGETDYLLAGRSLGLGLASVSLFATWFGAETVMGSSAAIAKNGLAGGRADPFGYSLCLLLMALLLAYKMRAANYVTLADFFRERFGSKTEKLAILVFAPTSLLWAAAQLLAFSKILEAVAHIPHETSLIGATIFILLYTIIGGMKADVIHDLLQGCIVIFGLAFLTYALIDAGGGIELSWQKITPAQLTLTPSGESWLDKLESWTIPVLGSLVAQEALSRLLATRNAIIARKACFTAAFLYLSVGILPVIIGLLSTHIAPDIPATTGDSYIILLAEKMLSPLLFILFAGALIAAILSTIDSTLLSLAAVLEHNLLSPLWPKASDAQHVKLARLCVAGSAIAAYSFASAGKNIYGLLELASSFGSAGIVITVLIGLNRRYYGRSIAAIITLLIGVAASLLGNLMGWQTPYLNALALCLLSYIFIAEWEKRQPAIANSSTTL